MKYECPLQVKADKIVENAKQEAAKVKAQVYEQTERTIADSMAKAEKVRLSYHLFFITI